MKHLSNKLFLSLCLITIIVNLFFASSYVRHKEITFHTDIARDLTLIREMVENKHPALLGPRAGAIEGLFHGPLWLYLNLPAFFLGRGNPLAYGWWWVLLQITLVASSYFVGSKITGDKKGGLAAAALVASRATLNTHQFLNPIGVELIAPWLLYYSYRYLKDSHLPSLLLSLIFIGFAIQFEIAFGMPILILFLLALIYRTFHSKQYIHLLSVLVLLLPLSTHLIFDIRHNWLETRAILSYLSTPPQAVLSGIDLIKDRIVNLFTANGLLTGVSNWASTMISIILIYLVLRGRKKYPHQLITQWFIYLYLGYWLISLSLPKPLEAYYYAGFVPMIMLIFSFYLVVFRSRWLNLFLYFILAFNTLVGIKHVAPASSPQPHPSSWRYNQEVARYLYDQGPDDFGYFVLNEDLYGYSLKYAISYLGQLQGSPASESKLPLTYVVVSKAASDHPSIDVGWWIRDQLMISSSPAATHQLPFHTIYTYHLTDEELSIPVATTALTGTLFR